ncbi:C-X-C chemokine receptor type 5 [Bagarius yarrelli]|uniref:C-X-C chemokine receptor type 5 n=1 Tax=Bagarius yarrelli TaxID=175774 RepID=A0A556V1V2_BAGYA|nr:C-X-C chemokine receptor type 5 [Bagarius yarrelli]
MVTICTVYKCGQKNDSETDNNLIEMPPVHKPAPPPLNKIDETKGGLISDEIQVVFLDKKDEMVKLPLHPPYNDLLMSETTAFTDKPARYREYPECQLTGHVGQLNITCRAELQPMGEQVMGRGHWKKNSSSSSNMTSNVDKKRNEIKMNCSRSMNICFSNVMYRRNEEILFEDSDSEDYENITDIYINSTCDTEKDPLLLYHTVFQPLVYSVMFLLGLSGNGLLLMVLLLRRAHLRITDIYLLHLALADLLLLITLPFAVTQMLTGWVFGNFMCKLVGLLNRLNLLCGSLLLAGIGFDRYLAIVHVVSSLQTRRPQTVNLICAVLWLFCLALSMPNIVFLSVVPRWNDHTWLQCHFSNHGMHSYNWLLVSRFLTHLLCFLLPLVIMGYCYTAVVVTLYRSQQSLEKQGAIRLAMVITLVFCVCWLPYNITLFVDTLVRLGLLSQETCLTRNALALGLKVTESIGFVHCCLNPILYAFIGVRFRNDLLRLLIKYFPVCGPFLFARCFSKSSLSDLPTTTSISQRI